MVVDFYMAHQKEIEDITDKHWAGDCVLGKVFKDAGVRFTNSWPIFQGNYPGTVQYARTGSFSGAKEKIRVWCRPSISYHHVAPNVIEDLWHFEQEWFASEQRVRYASHRTIG